MKELLVGIVIAFPFIVLIGFFVGKTVMKIIMDACMKYEKEADDDAT